MKKIVLVVFLFSLFFTSCEKNEEFVENGVSRELATERRANIGGVSYKLYFSVPFEESEKIVGESEISFELLNLSPVILDFKEDKNNILSISIENKKIPYTFKNEHIIIQPEYLKEGRNKINISFIAGESSLNRSSDLMYTLLVPDRCRTLMPCFDQPDIKATFKLRLRIPVQWSAVANGVPVRVEYFDNYKLYEFSETKPLSTYLFAFTVGRYFYDQRYVNGRWIGIYHRETDANKIAHSIPEIAKQVSFSLRWMENYTGIRYPFDVYNVVAIPSFQYGGMEHPGATYYLSSRVFLDENADLSAQITRTNLIAHETAHMWFGDLVTMKWFDDVWLKEVFAGFMADKIVAEMYPFINHDLNFFLAHYEPSLKTDRTLGTHPIIQPLENLKDAGTLYGDIIYHKAPVVMRMLENMITSRELRIGLQKYLRKWSYSNADWNDLITLLQTSSGKNLEAWNEIWVKEEGAPLIEYKRDGLKVTDIYGKHRYWPQVIASYYESFGRLNAIGVEITDTLIQGNFSNVVIPDGNLWGYGCFLPNEFSIRYLDENLNKLNPLLRALSWQLLYEGVLNKKVKAEFFVKQCIKHLAYEKDNQITNRTLSFLTIVYNSYLDQAARQMNQDELERFCKKMMLENTEVKNRKSYFKTLLSIYSTQTIGQDMYKVLKGEIELDEISLDDLDKLNIAYNCVLRDTSLYTDVYNIIHSSISNMDMIRRFEYIYPALSGDKGVRDSKFNSLLQLENRGNETWVTETLQWLNHPRRRMDSEEYIPKVLDELIRIQQTGDIFFPNNWLRASLTGHTSKTVYNMVQSFLDKNPNYPTNLRLKILANSDHLRRLHTEINN